MRKQVFDFLSSFGMVVAGVILLFVFSVKFTSQPEVVARLPKSGVRLDLFGQNLVQAELPVSRPLIPIAKNKIKFSGKLSAASALVVDDRSEMVLYAYKPDHIRPLASVTKLMSALVLLDLEMNWDSTTTVTENDDVDSSHCIAAGEKYTAEDLWHVALIGSANSAINSLVRLSGLTTNQFVEKMNLKAKDLGLQTLRFVEPTGLDARNVGNARDIAVLLKEALAKDRIKNTLQTPEYYSHPLNKDKPRRIWSTNWLLTKWVPCDFSSQQIVGKTGYIADSGYNFTMRVDDGKDHSIRVVVLGTESTSARFTEARDLAEWVFGHYVWPDQLGYTDLSSK